MEEERNIISGGIKTAGERITALLFILFLIYMVLNRIGGGKIDMGGIGAWFSYVFTETAFADFLAGFYFWFKFFSVYFSLVLIILIVYTVIKFTEVNKKEADYYREGAVLSSEDERVEGEEVAAKAKWKKIQNHIDSDNPSNWRLAILEADILLDSMIDDIGGFGETLGDKLKNADKNKFTTIDKAWEAHKIRNLIAHEGEDFLISQREARRVIGLYKDSFDEFNYV
ncbi:MAG: hypothetical protein A3G52_03935 [Candidatus Taylorbacteria bacterium RIFCSPLOWO2_12_FULL_43_20]|uniref:Uncharacterized protein n=1 Tax=Candidatus Taylorbacteria bacterium RIFCSPLOWO2_12_FULL_43_20 TaxID=1802332 RepID=A0A1G2P1V8_9BACT|nr:MAG: hypothetical protein A2825_02190 [Candidatus Taylorbacteria bacterium RIFCSPHIGHO2_01_FULL_43_120]OHA22831.1 MAG: hypothetical protein A3B98_01395 [Candidatus Taylorbacteria bacterium RIFCSPHIGHO2_02_FULL_43_55]OHA29388.1 MAG: hypothetical protein A3E92_02510 [Candidatus Taylorbacteria bacterium RIFCSPHIGHO2_12_FULL_42_34]OHA31764.1 MAG: hypothetical protein A3B09_01950 [Candidatus Taylorbacteria bacterium RIFCSPLOWO2_01_FULL_43_83]OHA38579.1 MAG: hypothetical protein A3H58_00235 [Candi